MWKTSIQLPVLIFFVTIFLLFAPLVNAQVIGCPTASAGTLTITPDPACAGAPVSTSGSGWCPVPDNQIFDFEYILYFDGSLAGIEIRQLIGTGNQIEVPPEVTFTVPQTASTGDHSIRVDEIRLSDNALILSKSFTIQVLNSAPTAGTLIANPSSGQQGTMVAVTGTGWVAEPTGSEYNLLFDGNPFQPPVTQTGLACSTQPNLQFTVPCGTTPGTHTITNQLVDSATQQVLKSSQPITFNVLASGPSIVCPPFISSISPSRGLVATKVPKVTIIGVNFGNSPTISIEAGSSTNNKSDIRVRQTLSGDTRIEAEFSISDKADGPYFVRVCSSTKLCSDFVTFFVQVPRSLMIVSGTVLPTGCTGCRACTATQDFGIEVAINYQVLDQLVDPIMSSDMEPQETVTNAILNGVNTGDPQPKWADIGPILVAGTPVLGTSQFTDANGMFVDAPFGACAAQNLKYTFTQQISMLIGGKHRYVVRTNNVLVLSTAAGHGLITNNFDFTASR